VRVRFAPSPLGRLSVKGARAALFNWLFARKHDGAFILRLFDVDVPRCGPEEEAALLDDLSWLGLVWDEGPDLGGDRGPYRQSERLDSYRAKAIELLDSGLAYRCFCTREDLDEEGAQARAAGLPSVYSGRCLTIEKGESDSRAESGEVFTVRFKVPKSGEVIVDDLIRGRVSLGALMVGDFVLLDSHSLPTYDFAAVLDDDSMKVTHVLRGEDRLPNTLRQVFLYNALELNKPAFGHLPLITRPDGDKLTGHRSMAAIKWFREHGYLAQTMFNYLALLGWSPGDDREVMDMNGLVNSFSLQGISSDATVFDATKLSWMNAHYLRSVPEETFWSLASRFVPAEWIEKLSQPATREAALLVRRRVKTLRELAEEMGPFIEHNFDAEAVAALNERWATDVLTDIAAALEGRSGISRKSFLALITAVGKRHQLRGKSIFVPVRAAITGRLEGPEIGAVAKVLGVRELRRRLAAALEMACRGSGA
jgi:glutamyl-tRNA synthetase